LNVTGETKLRDIVQPYAIHTFGTDKVGIIGLISPNLFQQGSPGSTVSLMDTANSVAKAVEALREVKVENIILMSSWAREVEDLAFIATTAGVDIVVTNHATRYDSPLVVTGLTGRPVYVLSAGIYGKYLGVFTAEFDNEGLVANYTGSPIYVTAKRVPTPDSAIDAKVASANNEVEVFKMVDVGYNNYFLNASRDLCRHALEFCLRLSPLSLTTSPLIFL
jgi:2',3'-cyclic-nucleotide 2'-phosphodiesterase (5'-nucleotidase family)